MGKMSKVYFLTAYIEYLLDQGIRSEDYYLGDASRFLRFLLQKVGPAEIEEFLTASANSDNYRRRLRENLAEVLHLCREHLEITSDPFGGQRPG
ncbi:MAG: hypothetical protein ACOX20_09205 [Limnochordia bacterium]